jgi:hypothetical protein
VTISQSRENYQWMVQSRRLIKLTTSCAWGERSTAARLSPRLLQAKRARLLSPSPQMTSDPSSPVLRLDPTTHTMANRGNHFSSCISQSTRNFPRNDQQKPMPTRKPHRQQLGGPSPQPPELLKVSPVACVQRRTKPGSRAGSYYTTSTLTPPGTLSIHHALTILSDALPKKKNLHSTNVRVALFLSPFFSTIRPDRSVMPGTTPPGISYMHISASASWKKALL